MRRIVVTKYDGPCGRLRLGAVDGRLCMCDWMVERHRELVDRRLRQELGSGVGWGAGDVSDEAVRELDEYFAGTRQRFDVPLMFVGTEFQKRAWTALLDIPYGTTESYGAMAARMGCPNAVRAVANANGANAISIFAPCHRVIGSDSKLTGYGGGLEVKRFLLELERGRIAPRLDV